MTEIVPKNGLNLHKFSEFSGPSTTKASPRHATSTALVTFFMTSELVSCNCAYLLSQKVSMSVLSIVNQNTPCEEIRKTVFQVFKHN